MTVLVYPIVKVFFIDINIDNLGKMKDTYKHTQVSCFFLELVMHRCNTNLVGLSLLHQTAGRLILL